VPDETTPRVPLTAPAPIGAFVARGMFAYRSTEDGKAPTPVERQRTCGCGREFTQSLMAPTELAALERMGHIATFMRQVPDCFVPVHCPRCERGQITLQTQIDEGRARSAGTASSTMPDRRAS
jgi:hypothetical protein